MGRRKLSWQELRDRGCKRSRWEGRKRESENPAVIDFLAAVRKVDSTFKSRLVPGETLLREFNGLKFDWPTTHNLTVARDTAIKSVNDKKYKWPETQVECRAFLNNLETGEMRGQYMDPEACANISLYFSTFGEEGDTIYTLTLFDLVEWMGWKKADSEYVLGDGELLGFDPPIVTLLDKAYAALKQL